MRIIELDIDSGGNNFYNYCFFYAILFSDWYPSFFSMLRRCNLILSMKKIFSAYSLFNTVSKALKVAL